MTDRPTDRRARPVAPVLHPETIPAVHVSSGAHARPVSYGHTLTVGTRLHEFEITGVIGEGGFGIVYLAYDPTLQRQVAIKEYMPGSLASRATTSMTIAPRATRHTDTFRSGLKSFINEARLLAYFDHPALVKVYRFWEDNGTAYMVMPYYEGPTLRHALGELPAPPDEAALRHWLDPLLDALAVLHAEHCYHRDIAPDNILLTETGPLLLDFGAARRVVGDMTHALTVMLKPGYAPIEQYGESPSMRQGPWTDLYALACVVSYAITGEAPPSSVERLMGDRRRPLVEAAAGLYSATFLSAIDRALAVQPAERPQSVAQFRALLDGADAAATDAPAPTADAAGRAAPDVLPAAPPVTLADIPLTLAPTAEPAPATPPATPPAFAPAKRPTGRRRPVIGLVAAAAVVALAGGWWLLRDAPPPTQSDSARGTPEATGSTRPRAETPAAPVPAPSPAPTPAPTPATAPTPTPAAPAEPSVTAEPPPPAPSPAPRPARRDAPAVSRKLDTPPPAAVPAPAPHAMSDRCIAILQKASLGTIDADEAKFLKEECR